MRLYIELFISVGVVSLFCFHPAYGLGGFETRLTTDPHDQTDPAVSGLYVVYTDMRYGNKDIYLYDVGTSYEADLTPGTPNDQYLEDVDGTHVVYTNVNPSANDILLYDIATSAGTPLTSGGNNYGPTIQGNHVVWAKRSNGVSSIVLADISAWTSFTIASSSSGAGIPRVDGDYVVWERNNQRFSPGPRLPALDGHDLDDHVG
jgi:beta propeller repeat protein